MVAKYRLHFQEYLISSLGDKNKLMEENRRLKEELVEKENLLTGVQASYTAYMSNSLEVKTNLREKLLAAEARAAGATEPAVTAVAGVGSGMGAVVGKGPLGGGTSVGAVHPAYLARSQRPGWEARWGTEEVQRVATV
ncbi:unnamed protein product [Choristocarpus tenellus]